MANHAIAIYPGSFDPITLGHLDIIKRGSQLFNRVIVAVLCNPSKQPLFTLEQRVTQIRSCTKYLVNVEVESFKGLTVEYAKSRQAGVLLRGLRVLSDFEKELQMAHTNNTLNPELETVFLATSNEYSFLSSSVVKEVARFGGAVDHLVPENVAREVYQCYKNHPEATLTVMNSTRPKNPSPDEPETSISKKNSTDSKI
jgi:pantetheine-phosphate adenylyltransferase